MNLEDHNTEAAVVAELAQKVDIHEVFGRQAFASIPDGMKTKDLAEYFPEPHRRSGKAVLTDAASFVKYIELSGAEKSQILVMCNTKEMTFNAVLNPTAHGNTGWGDWTAGYACPPSKEWQTWTRANSQQMTQDKFAAFIEDNALDIIEPTPADMIEISRSLQAKKKVNFASGIRLSNGQTELTYEEEIAGTAAKGKLQIPESFFIAIPVFELGANYKIEARLRYRIDDSSHKLLMWFDLLRHDKSREDALKEVREMIAAGLGLPVLNGTY